MLANNSQQLQQPKKKHYLRIAEKNSKMLFRRTHRHIDRQTDSHKLATIKKLAALWRLLAMTRFSESDIPSSIFDLPAVVGGYWLGVVCLLCDLTFSLTLPFVSAVTTSKLKVALQLELPISILILIPIAILNSQSQSQFEQKDLQIENVKKSA